MFILSNKKATLFFVDQMPRPLVLGKLPQRLHKIIEHA